MTKVDKVSVLSGALNSLNIHLFEDGKSKPVFESEANAVANMLVEACKELSEEKP